MQFLRCRAPAAHHISQHSVRVPCQTLTSATIARRLLAQSLTSASVFKHPTLGISAYIVRMLFAMSLLELCEVWVSDMHAFDAELVTRKVAAAMQQHC